MNPCATADQRASFSPHHRRRFSFLRAFLGFHPPNLRRPSLDPSPQTLLHFSLLIHSIRAPPMGDWQELGQAIFFGLVFSYLVAKLISTVVSFKEDNLRIVREADLSAPEPDDVTRAADPAPENDGGVPEEQRELLTGGSSLGDEDDEDDWEGIESTELDEAFSAASAFVAATAADRATPKVSSDLQLQLYALYKIATEGCCTAPQPSALNVKARAKWNAWQKLGAMPPEQAMEKYIMIVSELFPSWANGSTIKKKDEGTSDGDSASKGPMGPVFSSLVCEEDSENDLKLDPLHVCAREGEAGDLLKHIDNGVSVNLRDSEGRTPLHWAVDRGHLDVVEALLNRSADVNAKDNDGQTPLHYAALCEEDEIAKLLLKHHADRDIKDVDGKAPTDLCGSSWSFMTFDG